MKARREAPVEVPCFGTLSADWPLVPLRYLVRFLSGGTPDKGNSDFWSGGTIPWVSPKDMKIDRIDDSEDHITEAALDGSATQVVPVGSVLVVVRGMILAHTLPVAVTTGPVTINQDIKALVCGLRILPDFLHAVLAGQAEWLLSQTDSSAHGTKKLETEVLERFEVPCPPLELQRKIVTAIRSQATDLDGIVLAKQRVLDLLAEKRTSIIATAVTRGLDPRVRLRDSGVSWLGEIPRHWQHRNLRFCCTAIQTGGTPSPEFLDYDGDDGLDWLTPGDFSESLVPQRSSRRVAPGALTTGELRMFPSGSVLVVGIGATLGKVAMLSRPASANQQVNALIPRDDIHGSFLAYEMTVLAELLRVSANTATLPILNQQRMGDVPVLVPPVDEQKAIVGHIARETAKLDAVRAATERTIALLKERRAALIAAAVTGQLDVGTAA
jgi:type I restriction enzyme S subunit